MKTINCKVLVLGGGPGGYAAAIKAGHLGLETVLVENDRLGGTCLNVGCIPSKALIHAAEEFQAVLHHASGESLVGISLGRPTIDLKKTAAWKDGIVGRLSGGVANLLKKARVSVIKGWGELLDGRTCEVETSRGTQRIIAEHVILATGSEPVELPSLPFGGPVISSSEALALTKLPKRLCVVGGGYIGLELGTAFTKLGALVTVVESEERILPHYDAELTRPVAERLKAMQAQVLTGARALGMTERGDALRVRVDGGGEIEVKADRVLVTVGRRPRTSGWGIDNLVLDMQGPFIRIDDRCQTSMKHVWAVGDVTGGALLAHRALAQGVMVAELIAGNVRSFDKVCIPAVCFTDPEVVVVGLLPDQAKDAGLQIKTGVFPFAANGRAMTMEAGEGFVRVVARADNHLVLGIQAVGRGVAELSAGFALALEMGARLEDIAETVHTHPTLGEALQEAAFKALGQALHL
ncbi:MAG TPA: dihydrolipoyl dehydrogenase [Desulfurivibrionaceae bacterium]|nr:dihydrolipoyl dehydrogenase [Desulfurivibrionaceae bacterium]